MSYFPLSSSLNCIFSFAQTCSLLTCFSFFFGLYFVADNLLRRCVEALIKNICIPKLNRLRLIYALWRIKLCIICFILYRPQLLKCVSAGSSSVMSSISDMFSVSLISDCKFTLNSDLSNVLYYYVAPLAFFIHELYISLHSRNTSSTIALVFFSLFLHTSFRLQRLDLNIKVLLLIVLSEGSMELARTCLILKSRCKGVIDPTVPVFLKISAVPLFMVHIFIRLAVCFYLYPALFLSLPSLSEAEGSSRLATAYINIFLTLYFPWQVFYSPLWSLLEITMRPKLQRPLRLSAIPSLILLPYSGPLLYELREIQLNSLKNLPLSSAEIRTMRHNLLSQGKHAVSQSQQSQGLDHAGGLLSVVKCMIALKKKMRHRYERKLASENDESNLPLDHDFDEPEDTDLIPSTPNQEDTDFIPSTSNQEADDITDIFISVPSRSQTSLNKAKEISEDNMLLQGNDVTLPASQNLSSTNCDEQTVSEGKCEPKNTEEQTSPNLGNTEESPD